MGQPGVGSDLQVGDSRGGIGGDRAPGFLFQKGQGKVTWGLAGFGSGQEGVEIN